MDLGAYLQAASQRRWRAGLVDCTTFAADWVVTWGMGDPMAHWRGLYRTDEEAASLVQRGGGLAMLWTQGMGAIGVERVAFTRIGDVAVIRAVGMDREPVEVGAIWTGRRWAFRVHNGLAFASADPLAVWGLRNG